MSRNAKAVVVLSGGQDSTTCLYAAKRAGYAEIHAITFDYGQRHSRELDAATHIAKMAGVDSHEILPLGARILHSASPLVSNNELEQYKDHQSLPGGIEKTFVPMRNMLFLTLAANRAVEVGAQYLYTGVCQEDFGGYPDCRQVFVQAVQAAINLSNEGAAKPIEIMTPLMDLTKADSVRLALSLPGCYEALAYSHTAYDGQYPPVGRDHATLLRAKGFEQANVPDPLVLRAWAEGLMDIPASHNYDNECVHPILELIPLTKWAQKRQHVTRSIRSEGKLHLKERG